MNTNTQPSGREENAEKLPQHVRDFAEFLRAHDAASRGGDKEKEQEDIKFLWRKDIVKKIIYILKNVGV